MKNIQLYFMSGVFKKQNEEIRYFDSLLEININFDDDKYKLFNNVIEDTRKKVADKNKIPINMVTITAFNKLLL